jgi:hypothetical protein
MMEIEELARNLSSERDKETEGWDGISHGIIDDEKTDFAKDRTERPV